MREGYAGRALTAARERPWLILICIVVALAATWGLRETQTPAYRAEATVLFRATNLDSSVLGGSRYFVQSVDPSRAAATNLQVTQSQAIAERVARRMSDVDASVVRAHVSFAQQGDSDVVAIVGRDSDPSQAARYANLWSEELVAFRRETDQKQIEQAIELVENELRARGGGGGAASEDVVLLRSDLDKLRLVKTLQTGDVQRLDEAEVPSSPTGTPLSLALGVAGVAGALVGLFAATVLSLGDRRIRTLEQASASTGLGGLAAIPKFPPTRRGGSGGPVPLAVTEAFRGLALRLRFFNVDREHRCIAVVSCSPAEGKSTVALHLATMSAAAGRRTLLMDCDLRRGEVARRLDVDTHVGLTEVLSGQRTLEEAVVGVPCPAAHGGSDAELWVLPRGTLPPNPTEMLASRGFAGLLKACSETYDLVVIDSAPLLAVPDTEALLRSVDGAVVVVRAGVTSTGEVSAVRRSGVLGQKVLLGVVLNAQTKGRKGGGYYGYGDGQPARGPSAAKAWAGDESA